MITKISYNLPWAKALEFIAKLDVNDSCYTLLIDRHGRALIVLDMQPIWNKYNKPKE